MTTMQAISRIVLYCRHNRHSQAFLQIAACAVLVTVFSAPQPARATIVRMETALGGFNIELHDADAPQNVANFLNYVGRGDASNGGYDNTLIHRSEPGFVIQGGGFFCPFVTSPSCHIATDPPITNEYSPTHPNVRGSIAMALNSDQFGNPLPNSATSEWFINLVDNSTILAGYTVFGLVLDSGMDVVDTIAALPRSQLPFSPFQAPTVNGNYVFTNHVCVNNDGDAACPAIEDLAPNNGDGNGDSTPDRDQENVTTTLSIFNRVVTFATDTGAKFEVAGSLGLAASQSLLTQFSPPSGSTVQFNDGLYTLKMIGTMGAGRVATLFNSFTTTPNHYYAYGPTPDNATPHWYDFTFDSTTGTGAEFVGNKIMLHFVDGQRGDNDSTSGSISHIGAPVLVTDISTGSSSSNGCSITTTPSQMTGNSDWAIISLFLAFVALVRRRARNDRIQRVPR